MARIILFGATGYTGRLTAAALVQRGHNPILAGRSAARLSDLAWKRGIHSEIAVADASCDASLERLLSRGDVMISTVGPFLRWGDSPVRAAMDRGAHYLDSNGEPPFTRRIFERYGAAAADTGVAVLTAFGWENVIGNLAGALALREAGGAATRIDTGYFYLGRTRFSGGTRASFAEAMIQPSFAFRDGAIRTVRGAERYRTMPVDVDRRPGVSLGASEHYALPRAFPQLREVNAYLGWFGGLDPRAARLLHLASRPGFAALRAPGLRALTGVALSRMLKGSSGGPSAAERAGPRRRDCLRRRWEAARRGASAGPGGLRTNRCPARLGSRACRFRRTEGRRGAGPGGRLRTGRARGRMPRGRSGACRRHLRVEVMLERFRHRLRVRDGESDPPRLIVVSGLPGTGKTRLAEALSTQLEIPVFSIAWVLGAMARFGALEHTDRGAKAYAIITALLEHRLRLGQ